MGIRAPQTTHLLLPHFYSCGHGREVKGLRAAGSWKTTPASSPDEPGRGRQVLKSWCLWFLAFFGIYASSSVCPFCGTPGCPVGAGGATLVGGLGAFLWRFGADIVKKVKEVTVTLIRYLREVFYATG